MKYLKVSVRIYIKCRKTYFISQVIMLKYSKANIQDDSKITAKNLKVGRENLNKYFRHGRYVQKGAFKLW